MMYILFDHLITNVNTVSDLRVTFTSNFYHHVHKIVTEGNQRLGFIYTNGKDFLRT